MSTEPRNIQTYTMTCGNDRGETRTVAMTTKNVVTEDMPEIYEEMYATLDRLGFSIWLHDSAIASAEPRAKATPFDGRIPVLKDLLAAVTRSAYVVGAGYPNAMMVSTPAFDALCTYLRTITGQVTPPHLLNPGTPLDDAAIAAILTDNPLFPATMTDEDMTHRINEILSGGDGPEDEAEWATPDDVMDLLAGQPDVPPTEEGA